MEKRKDIDMLRFYGGDIHQKNKEGEYVITNNLVNPKNKEDMLWGDRDAYRTLTTKDNHVYNATFLPQFNDDFWNFLCAFNKKYKIVEKLFDVAEKYYNVTLKIDRYWMMTVDEKGKIKKSTLSGVDYICEKEMMIECSILYNLKRYTFRRNERITFEDESLNKVLENLKAFLEKHSSKDKEESEK